ncbi:MAG: DUF4360 domain-containing protein [Polyangiaceae bacterium]
MFRTVYWLGIPAAIFATFGCSAPDPTEGSAPPEVLGEGQQALNGFYVETPIVGTGPGCLDPLTYTVTPDGQTFTVYFSGMVLQHPPGLTYKKINCTVGINLHLPEGQQFSITTVDTRGFAHLPQGTYADQRSKYFFSGQHPELRAHSRINGYYDDDWTYTDVFGIGSSLQSPCGGQGTLNIDTALILNTAANPHQDAYIDNTTVDGTFRMVFQNNWDHCEG